VIRHIVLIRTNEHATAERIERIREELAALVVPGRFNFTMGTDLGLRDDNMNIAIVADFDDIASYQAYAVDPAHDRIRTELIAPIAAHLERCQFAL
jgi:hypothetical protein